MVTMKRTHRTMDCYVNYERLFSSGASREEIRNYISNIPAVDIANVFEGIFCAPIPSPHQEDMARILFNTNGIAPLLTFRYWSYYELTTDPLVVKHRNLRRQDVNVFLQSFMKKCDGLAIVEHGDVESLLQNLDEESLHLLFEGLLTSTEKFEVRRNAVERLMRVCKNQAVIDTFETRSRDRMSEETILILNEIRSIVRQQEIDSHPLPTSRRVA
jgi:hypothetical protein